MMPATSRRPSATSTRPGADPASCGSVNVSEYEAMYRVEDTLRWYAGMRRIAEAVLDGRLTAGAASAGGAAAAPGRAGMKILDAGCGTGGNLRWLSRFGAAYGVDLSPHALRFCARRRLGTVSRASVSHLPFPDGAFDLVTSFDVIYHLDVADDVAALAEMRRVLKPGGWALIRVPALEQLRGRHDAAVHTRQRYTLAELEAKARRAGLRPARASYANTLLFPAAAAVRLARRVLPFEAGEASDVRPAPPAVNRLLSLILDLEAAIVRRVDLPVGLSALVLAQRPLGAAP